MLDGHTETIHWVKKIAFYPDKLTANTTVAWVGVNNSEFNLEVSDGRVAYIVAISDSAESARDEAYASIDAVYFEGKKFRNDIGILNNLS